MSKSEYRKEMARKESRELFFLAIFLSIVFFPWGLLAFLIPAPTEENVRLPSDDAF